MFGTTKTGTHRHQGIPAEPHIRVQYQERVEGPIEKRPNPLIVSTTKPQVIRVTMNLDSWPHEATNMLQSRITGGIVRDTNRERVTKCKTLLFYDFLDTASDSLLVIPRYHVDKHRKCIGGKRDLT
jgi:hypothetical protein